MSPERIERKSRLSLVPFECWKENGNNGVGVAIRRLPDGRLEIAYFSGLSLTQAAEITAQFAIDAGCEVITSLYGREIVGMNFPGRK